MKRRVVLSPDALRQLRRLRAVDRSLLRDAMEIHLEKADASQPTRRRFRLRRPASAADFELRVRDWRVFYRVEGREVRVVLIGRKRGNVLRVDGLRFAL